MPAVVVYDGSSCYKPEDLLVVLQTGKSNTVELRVIPDLMQSQQSNLHGFFSHSIFLNVSNCRYVLREIGNQLNV